MRDSIFLIPLNINSVIDTSRLPTYWERGAVTGFYPEKPDCKLEILQRLVHEVVSAKLSILILIFKNERLQIEYAFAAYSHRNIACADMEVLKDTQELGRIVKENHSEMLLVMFETADEDATKNSKRLPDITQELAIQASKELQLPIGVITASAPHNASAWLYDSVYFVQKDDSTGRLQFVDKPDKAKKQPAPIKNQDKGTGIIFERECLL